MTNIKRVTFFETQCSYCMYPTDSWFSGDSSFADHCWRAGYEGQVAWNTNVCSSHTNYDQGTCSAFFSRKCKFCSGLFVVGLTDPRSEQL